MEKIKNMLLVMIFMLLIGTSFKVHAESFNYYLSNSNLNYEYVDKNNSKTNNVKRGDTILVTAVLDNKDNISDYNISSGKLTVRWDENYLSLQEINGKYYNDSITDISGLVLGSVNKSSNKLTIGEISSTGPIKAGKNKIVEFKFLVLDDAKASETKIYQMDGEDSLKCANPAEEIRINCGDSLYSELKYTITRSTDNKLSAIKIDGHELEYFNENTNDYDITVENNVEKVKIEVTKKDSKAVVTGDFGENKLDYGVNKFTINVISESGVKNVYHINVTREDTRSNDNTLRTLSLSTGEITFKPEITEYTVNVDNEIDKITVKSSLNDTESKYVVDYQNKEVELVEGSNKIEIKVISEKGEERVYTLNINRALSSNNSLKSLKVNDEKINLVENEFIYNITVENTVDEIVITAVTNDAKATVKLNDKYPLEVGENEINIKVTAASGQEASYILNVTRKKILSKDSVLSSLKIKGYEINFKPTETLYNLKINDNDDELEITATTEDPNATVEIEGNKDLENGSIIKVNVKAEDGSYTRYFINIEKGSAGISPVIIIIIILLILLAACLGLIIYRRKKKEQAEFDKLDEVKNEVKENNVQEEVSNDSIQENIVPKEEETVEENSSVEENYVGAHEEKNELEKETDENEKDAI